MYSYNMIIIAICIFFNVYTSEQSEEHLPDIMWCREPFLENLNEIEALNDIKS